MSISIDELEIMFSEATHCPICEEKFSLELGRKHILNSPSLDRINNEHELRKDNVWIICQRCNAMKGDLTMKEFVQRSKNIVNKFKDVC